MRKILFFFASIWLSGCYSVVDTKTFSVDGKEYKVNLESTGEGSDFQLNRFTITKLQLTQLQNVPAPSNAHKNEEVSVLTVTTKAVNLSKTLNAIESSINLENNLLAVLSAKIARVQPPSLAAEVASTTVAAANQQAKAIVEANNIAADAQVVGADLISYQAVTVQNQIANADLKKNIKPELNTIKSLKEELKNITGE